MWVDAFRFFGYNLRHYSLAVWGLRLRFDPAYPFVMKFFPSLISEPVFEYRTYGLTAVWGIVLAGVLPLPVLTALVLGWVAISFDRSKYLKSNLVFWRQVLRENGVKQTRAHGRYMEWLIRDIEHRMKNGEDWQEQAMEAARLQEEVIRQAKSKDAARRILAGA